MARLPDAPLLSDFLEIGFRARGVKRIVGNRNGRHSVDELLVIDAGLSILRGNDGSLHVVVGDVVEVILVEDILINSVGDKNVAPPVVVHIEEQGAPAPVGGLGSGQAAHFREGAVGVVVVKHVAGELVVVIVVHSVAVAVPVLEGHGSFIAIFGPGQHFRYENFGVAVVVQIGHIRAHAGSADAAHLLGQFLPKSAVLLIDVEVIALEEVVAHEDVGPVVAVHIADRYAQPETDHRAVNARLFGHVHELPVVVAK